MRKRNKTFKVEALAVSPSNANGDYYCAGIDWAKPGTGHSAIAKFDHDAGGVKVSMQQLSSNVLEGLSLPKHFLGPGNTATMGSVRVVENALWAQRVRRVTNSLAEQLWPLTSRLLKPKRNLNPWAMTLCKVGMHKAWKRFEDTGRQIVAYSCPACQLEICSFSYRTPYGLDSFVQVKKTTHEYLVKRLVTPWSFFKILWMIRIYKWQKKVPYPLSLFCDFITDEMIHGKTDGENGTD